MFPSYEFDDAFYFVLVSPHPGGCGGGSGLPFSLGDRGFRADSGTDPMETHFLYYSYEEASWVKAHPLPQGSDDAMHGQLVIKGRPMPLERHRGSLAWSGISPDDLYDTYKRQ